MSVQFTSDGSVEDDGFHGTWTCDGGVGPDSSATDCHDAFSIHMSEINWGSTLLGIDAPQQRCLRPTPSVESSTHHPCWSVGSLSTPALLVGSGVVTDGPDNYENDQECAWELQCNDCQRPHLHLLEFETESISDYAEVFDGNNSAAPLLLRNLSGTIAVSEHSLLIATTSSLFVRFRTDSINSATGFRAAFTCESLIQADEVVHGEPQCDWLPSCAGTFDGTNRSTCDEAEGCVYSYDFESAVPQVTDMHYTSMYGSSAHDYYIDQTARIAVCLQPAPCYRITTRRSGICELGSQLSDGDHISLNLYEHEQTTLGNLECSWFISCAAAPVLMNFTVFSTEKEYDVLFVYDGLDTDAPILRRMSGGYGSLGEQPVPTVQSTGTDMFATFAADAGTVDSQIEASIICPNGRATISRYLQNRINSMAPHWSLIDSEGHVVIQGSAPFSQDVCHCGHAGASECDDCELALDTIPAELISHGTCHSSTLGHGELCLAICADGKLPLSCWNGELEHPQTCCSAGSAWSQVDNICVLCRPGLYDHDASPTTKCMECPLGYYSEAGASSCERCSEGTTSDAVAPAPWLPSTCSAHNINNDWLQERKRQFKLSTESGQIATSWTAFHAALNEISTEVESGVTPQSMIPAEMMASCLNLENIYVEVSSQWTESVQAIHWLCSSELSSQLEQIKQYGYCSEEDLEQFNALRDDTCGAGGTCCVTMCEQTAADSSDVTDDQGGAKEGLGRRTRRRILEADEDIKACSSYNGTTSSDACLVPPELIFDGSSSTGAEQWARSWLDYMCCEAISSTPRHWPRNMLLWKMVCANLPRLQDSSGEYANELKLYCPNDVPEHELTTWAIDTFRPVMQSKNPYWNKIPDVKQHCKPIDTRAEMTASVTVVLTDTEHASHVALLIHDPLSNGTFPAPHDTTHYVSWGPNIGGWGEDIADVSSTVTLYGGDVTAMRQQWEKLKNISFDVVTFNCAILAMNVLAHGFRDSCPSLVDATSKSIWASPTGLFRLAQEIDRLVPRQRKQVDHQYGAENIRNASLANREENRRKLQTSLLDLPTCVPGLSIQACDGNHLDMLLMADSTGLCAIDCAPASKLEHLVPGAQSCTQCGAGFHDSDEDPTTPCVGCPLGRYSDLGAGASCPGQCAPGESQVEELIRGADGSQPCRRWRLHSLSSWQIRS